MNNGLSSEFIKEFDLDNRGILLYPNYENVFKYIGGESASAGRSAVLYAIGYYATP
jgi:hypothetical protein